MCVLLFMYYLFYRLVDISHDFRLLKSVHLLNCATFHSLHPQSWDGDWIYKFGHWHQINNRYLALRMLDCTLGMRWLMQYSLASNMSGEAEAGILSHMEVVSHNMRFSY